MATACFLLNIAPCKNNNECCLDITPEILFLQNIETMRWKRKHSLKEYTIPLTYKLKLKKKPMLEKSDDDMDRTYHSCVDLLLPSSLTKLNLEYNDRVKIISDTNIHSKISARLDDVNYPSNNVVASLATSNNLVIKKAVVDFKDNNVCTVVEQNGGENFIQESREDINVKAKDNLNEGDEQNYNSNETGLLRDSSNDRISSIYIASTNFNLMNKQNIETSTNIFVNKATNKDRVKQQLNLSPICAINIDDNCQNRIKIPAKPPICNTLYTKCDDLPVLFPKKIDEFASIENLSGDVKLNNLLIKTCIEENDKSFQRLVNKVKSRELPEVRVKKFIKAIRKEISPLQIMINEIISKCVSLGVMLNKSSGTYLMYKMPSYIQEMRCDANRQSIKSNRVVYSVVFDECNKKL